MRKKPKWRRYAFWFAVAMTPQGYIILWWLLPILLTLEDPIYTGAPYGPDDPALRGNRQVDGDQKRIPPSVHTKLDDVRRELRRSGIR